MLQALVSNNVSLSLRSAVALAAAQQPLAVSAAQQDAVVDFVSRRLEQLLVDAGVSAEAGALLVLGCKNMRELCVVVRLWCIAVTRKAPQHFGISTGMTFQSMPSALARAVGQQGTWPRSSRTPALIHQTFL
jgi:glycyl-tRNA synthetase beta subunit